ncbi:putative RNA-directed DNA polymerase [Helianthus debilis subsp. tardiflorus]
MSTNISSSSSTTTETKLPMATILHMLTIKLSSTNYLYWQNQLLPLLANQNLLGHVDGSLSPPPKTITAASAEQPNPAYTAWSISDQQAILILNSSLTEEAVAEILGLTTARQIWTALEAAYSNTSLERMHLLRDNLRRMTKGSSTVADYGRRFKAVCDQLSAIGHPVKDTDKTHWFLCGLGSTFESWSTAIRTTRDPLPFRDLLTKAESQEQFLLAINPPSTPSVAFVAQTNQARNTSSSQNRGSRRGQATGSYNRGPQSNFSNSSSNTPRRPPHCQLCRTNGHYANKCPKLSSFIASASGNEDIARAFHAQCHVQNEDAPDWAADTGADRHMTDDTGPENKPTSRSRSV